MRQIFIAALLALVLPSAGIAATVVSGSTQVGDTGGINAFGTTSTASDIPGLFSDELTDPTSDWVWSGDSSTVDSATYVFLFELDAFQASVATLSGMWGVDNTGTVNLNGTVIATLSDVVVENFTSLSAYGTTDSSLFNTGFNILTFSLFDAGGQAGFRATAVVDVAPVPLPASAALMLVAFGGLA